LGSDLTILAFDTSAAHCAAALLSGTRILSCRSEAMTRGQAERLAPLVQEVLAEGGCDWSALDRIGVGIGPGNFTGLRISVAFARGLALALDRPAIGVSTFDAIDAAGEAAGDDTAGIVAVPGPRGQFYIRRANGAEPELVDGAQLAETRLRLPPDPAELVSHIARLAALRSAGPAPAPLYLRPADAAPARDGAPVILP
jgi:tRNA threonylcarbamoyl adenosine modification protein YeaZ